MPDAYQPWIDLSEGDLRSMLFALIGFDFGPEPEKRIPEIKESRKAYSNYVADQCRVVSTDLVLDLGSGCGFGTYWLAKRAKHVDACDISPAYLSFAKRECGGLDNVSFHLVKSRSLGPIADNSIDAICSMSVFIHLNLYDIYWYFSEFKRVLKRGGRLWLDFANSESLDLSAPNTNGGYFLRHAKQYRDNPAALPGLMQWNSAAAVSGIARHFGFKPGASRRDGELLLVKEEEAASRGVLGGSK